MQLIVIMIIMAWWVIMFKTSQIKYVNAEQKLMVTVVRCEGLQKEKGPFGGYHNDDNYDNDDGCLMMAVMTKENVIMR